MLKANNFLQAYGKLPDDSMHLPKTVTFEDALVSSPLFRKHRLCLYRQSIHFIAWSWMEIQYLIVKDQVPILNLELSAFRIVYDDQSIIGNWYAPRTADKPPELMIYTKNKSLQDLVDDVTAHLELLLNSSDQPYRKSDSHVPVPKEYHEAMARLHMIRKQTDCIRAPTLYGDSLGLMDGYMIQDDGRPCHTFFIPSERMAELERALAWPRICLEEQPKAVLTLEQRLEKARQGLPGNNASAIAPVRAFGAMRLADYMGPFPEYAERLRQRFGELETFQEAADRIFQVCVSGDMSDPAMKDCTELMEALIIPILDTCVGEGFKRPADGVIAQSSETFTGKHVPDSPAVAPIKALMRRSFPTLLMGAAMAAGQPCLLQNTQFILDDVLDGQADKLSTSCWTLANYPFRIPLLVCADTDDPEKQKNFNMLFHLFIQPFALLHRAAVPSLEGPPEPVHSI